MAVSEDGQGTRALAAAAQSLRAHTDTGWHEVRPGLLDRVRRAVRPAAPVRGRHADGEFTVSSAVLATRVGAVVDRVPGARVRRVSCVTDESRGTEDLATVLVETAVEFGAELVPVSAAVRAAVLAELSAVLGYRVPERVVLVDVHVADVYSPPVY
jgi:hypothetical protein